MVMKFRKLSDIVKLIIVKYCLLKFILINDVPKYFKQIFKISNTQLTNKLQSIEKKQTML